MKKYSCSYDSNSVEHKKVHGMGFLIHFAIYLMVVGGQWKVWLFSGGHHHFPIWITLFWGIGVYSHYKKTFGVDSEHQPKERKLENEFI